MDLLKKRLGINQKTTGNDIHNPVDRDDRDVRKRAAKTKEKVAITFQWDEGDSEAPLNPRTKLNQDEATKKRYADWDKLKLEQGITRISHMKYEAILNFTISVLSKTKPHFSKITGIDLQSDHVKQACNKVNEYELKTTLHHLAFTTYIQPHDEEEFALAVRNLRSALARKE